MDVRQLAIGRVEHRRGDSWYPMEERSDAHRPRDTEREWAGGRVYHCKQCDEYIRVVPEGAERR